MVTGYDPSEVRERLSLLQITPEIWQKPLDGDRFLARLQEIVGASGAATQTQLITPTGENPGRQ